MTQLSPEEERRLVRALKRGDERAFAQLVREFQTPVYNLVFRMMGHRREDALDVSQEVFVTVFRAVGGFRQESRLGTWIYRIAVNHCRNRIKYQQRRHQQRHTSFDDAVERSARGGEAFESSVPRPDAEVEGLRAEEFLKRAIGELDPEQREVLLLRDVQGLTYDEIAEITGLALGTVKSRIHRARQGIQAAWRSYKEG